MIDIKNVLCIIFLETSSIIQDDFWGGDTEKGII
jgi:hypothetical protein